MTDLAPIEETRNGIDFSRPVNLRLTVRNGILLQAIRMRAPSVAAFCRVTGYPVQYANDYIGFKRDPVRKDGNWRDDAVRLCSLLDIAPEDGFPPEIVSRVKRNTVEVFCEASESANPQLSPRDEAAFRDISAKVRGVIATLSDRERIVIERRFLCASPATLGELGGELGVSRARISQIEASAIRKLRYPSRLAVLKEAKENIEELEAAQ